jgi:hypothetical protein
MDAESKRHLAKACPQFLVLAHEAEQRGLDKQPRFEERLDFAKLQILSQELMRQVQQEAAQAPAGDVEAYYRNDRFHRRCDPVRLSPRTGASDYHGG